WAVLIRHYPVADAYRPRLAADDRRRGRGRARLRSGSREAVPRALGVDGADVALRPPGGRLRSPLLRPCDRLRGVLPLRLSTPRRLVRLAHLGIGSALEPDRPRPRPLLAPGAGRLRPALNLG